MTNDQEEPEYLLGTGDDELARLEFQHQVWRDLCIGALERAGVREGHRVLDLGCGPGFAASEIARMVGGGGEVALLDESPRWHRVLAGRDFAAPTTRMETTIEDAALEPEAHDIVYSRWVLSFLPDIDAVCRKALDTLRPGGAFVVQDYNHDGIAVFPRSEGFEAVVRAARAFYADAGGDAWVVTRLPAALRRAGFTDVQVRPHAKAGGPSSGVFRWAGAFFPAFSATFVERGLMTAQEQELFLSEWAAREADPDALFFSPMVVEVSGRRPA
ncbi:MAG: methyltransferase domain-containing protein [Planctomycetota bacterium]|nr:methyltransferase domain-containing protein [Planctomycetota bacterium]MEC8496171.1 methyltransferase domain-containing protein [Planctomycetota bacterium]MEC8513430.1 methyltransferase domain-containing protein [Planctomycetota bacterium]